MLYRTLFFLLIFLFSAFIANAQCDRQSDSLELVRFYNATDGPNWSDPWNLSQPMTTWEGINFNGGECVSEIQLFARGLKGELIDLNIPQLTVLNLFFNTRLTGKIPDFSGIPRLWSLWLHVTDLSGPIPDFSNIPRLRNLRIGGTNVFPPTEQNLKDFGEMPKFTNLPNLTEFFSRYTKLTGEASDFSNLTRLERIYISNNNFSGDISDFSDLPNLITLDCINNDLTGNLDGFKSIFFIEVLDCSGNNLTGNVPDLSNRPFLETLNCADNNLTGEIPNLTNVPLLTSFNCSNNNLTGTIPELRNLLALESINCSNNNLTGSIPMFTNLPVLRTFNCSNNNLKGIVPEYPSLTNFSYQENNFTFEDFVDNWSRNRFIGNHNFSPQKYIYKDTFFYFKKGASLEIDLVADAQLTTNLYTWKKNQLSFTPDPINNPTSNILILPDLEPEDAGVYQVSVTNSIVTPLTIESHPIPIQICDAQSDSLQLVELYNATQGSNWNNNNNWLQNGIPFSTWHGITVDHFGCVQKIDLSSKNLNGTLPDLNLNTLDTLILKDNLLSDSIPDSLYTPFLTYLDLSDNQLGGDIPPVIATLTDLTVLNLDNNKLSSTIPPDIGDLCELEELRLGGNDFEGELPEELTMLFNLQIGRVDFSDNIIDSLKPKIAFFCPFGDTILQNNPSYNRFLGICNIQCDGMEWDNLSNFPWIADTLAAIDCQDSLCTEVSADAGFVDVRGIKVIYTRVVCYTSLNPPVYSEEVLFYDCGGNLLETALCDQNQFCTSFGAISENEFKSLTFDIRWSCGQTIPGISSVKEPKQRANGIKRNQLLVFPNPTSGDFYFERIPDLEVSRLRIINLQGKEQLFETTRDSELIRINPVNWSPGIYFLSYYDENQVFFSKIIYQD